MPFHLQPHKRKVARETKEEPRSALNKAKEDEGSILLAIRNRCEAPKGISGEYECKNKDEHYLVTGQFPDYQDEWLKIDFNTFH